MATERLNVIGLISGGKDSFFSLLHCIEHGHRLVALANLFPAAEDGTLPIETEWIDPEASLEQTRDSAKVNETEETDLNSFMYQTVGHEAIPMYAAATGLPLYRRQIHGSAVRHERDYDYSAMAADNADNGEETESMAPLLRSIMEKHPEANAVCAGAILSTYQRTRVESVALRLGLTPLAYLWKYPILPSPAVPQDDAQLLRDMAAVGLDARIIKVASAGLDEDHLWLRASSIDGSEKVKRALRKFGASQGAALGEGGEFETLVVDGPRTLFRRRLHVPDEGRSIVREGGGTSWLKIRGSTLEEKELDEHSHGLVLRQPDLLDQRFNHVLAGLTVDAVWASALPSTKSTDAPSPSLTYAPKEIQQLITRTFQPAVSHATSSIQSQTSSIVAQARQFLESQRIDPSQVLNTLITLRDMADFPAVNAEYSKLFTRANPPSRVTISCGGLLVPGADIVVSITFPASSSGRQGLHVQSRSYWAPANIGPYSQGVSLPLYGSKECGSLRCVSIAGQIPLIPATMVLPEPSETSPAMQITLSLQHLWRIAADMRVQWWSSAVAYFSAAESAIVMQRRARMAGYAWTEANRPPPEDEEDDARLDPWDLKHNSEYMTLGNSDEQSPQLLPDWSLLPLRQQNDWECRLPPVFSAEVAMLPRQAEVEWHAHMGISGAREGAVETFSLQKLAGGTCDAWHMLVRENDGILLHTTVSYDAPCQENGEAVLQQIEIAYRESLQALKMSSVHEIPSPYLAYMASGQVDMSGMTNEGGFRPDMALVPCYSLWAADGTQRCALALHRLVLGATQDENRGIQ